MRKLELLFAAAWLLALSGPAIADDVREYTQGGVTVRDTYRTVRVPKTEIRCVERPQTFYQERVDVRYCDSVRTYPVPVTEYRWEPHWRGRFNPFVQPYAVYRYVPRTHWEMRSEVVKVPVPTRQLVPVTTTVRVPITTQTVVDQNVLVSRTLVSSPVAPSAPTAAGSPAIGGLARYSGDPPRRGINTGSGGSEATRTAAATQWRTVAPQR